MAEDYEEEMVMEVEKGTAGPAGASEGDTRQVSPMKDFDGEGKENRNDDDGSSQHSVPSAKVNLSSDEDEDQLFSAKKVSKARKLIVSDNSDEEEELLDIPPPSHGKSSIVPGHVLDPDIYGDDGDSSDGSGKEKRRTYESISNNRSSSDEGEKNSSKVERGKGGKSQKAEKYKNKTQRKASEKARAKTLQEIASETQKLVREKRIALPYHKPKQLTLDEFLKKRNQAKSRVFSAIAQQPSALGTMLNSLVKLEEDILPAIAKAEEEKKAAMSVTEDAMMEGHDGDDEDEELQERPNVTGVFQASDEKVGGWLEKDVVTTSESPVLVEDTAMDNQCDKVNEELVSEEIMTTPTPKDDLALDKLAISLTDEANHDGGKPNNPEEHPNQETVQDTKTNEKKLNDSLLEGEAELASFLAEIRPRPKRMTLAEKLRAMPGFEKVASTKPRVGGGKMPPTGIIELGDYKKRSKNGAKKEKAIQSLMDRFLKHAGFEEKSSKEQHHIVHVNTVEKDSQGTVQDMKTDEFDYVTKPVEKDGLLDIIAKPKKGYSPSGRDREAIPGEKMTRLREALKERILLQKTKDYEERLQEAEAQKKVEDESDEEIIEDDEIELSDSEEEEELVEENDMPKQRNKKKKSIFVNEEAEEDEDKDTDEDEDDDSSEDSDGDDINKGEVLNEESVAIHTDASQRKKVIRQIIYSDDEDEEILKADQKPEEDKSEIKNSEITPLSQIHNYCEQDNPIIADLVQSTALGKKPVSADDDVMDLCSGRFPSQAPLTPVESQDDCFGFDVDDDIVGDKQVGCNEVSENICESDDDEDDSESLFCKVSSKSVLEDAGNRELKTPSRKKDDDDSLNAEDDNLSVKSVEDVPDPDNIIEDELGEDDDDEEAALEKELRARSLQQSETPKRKSTGLFGKGGKLRRKFFEEEAELSGSEEGSGDEDEKGINYYEEEEGDQDELDDELVKNQVGRAHLKQMLDQDDRDIRLLQDQYLERGDLEDGKLRVRKFRWTDVDAAWGDDAAMMGGSDGEDAVGNEDEEEVKKRHEAIEKRKWLLEHPDVMEACAEESQKQLLQETTKFLKLGSRTQRKIESFLENSSSIILNETSSSVPDTSFATLVKSQIKASATLMLLQGEKKDPVSFGPLSTPPSSSSVNKSSSQPLFGNFASPDELTLKIKRGSFLSRDSPSLSRLAEITKSSDSINGTSNIKSNSRNFVFAVVTPPDQQNKQKVPKRPAASNSQGSFLTKKIKIDRSFSSLDDSSKDCSVFKYM